MTTEVLVIGGGLAGTAAAIQLARGGKQVTLVERERVPQHRVCGEFLSAEALQYLDLLGVDVFRLGAVPIERVRFAGSGKAAEAKLPFQAMSLTRRCLDAALLQQAERSGARVQRGYMAERLVRENDSWNATLATGEQITARAVFHATGKHDLRGHSRPAGKQPNLVAFKMYWRLSAEQSACLGQSVELITYRGGYAGLQPVEGGLANLCCLVQAKQLRGFQDKWAGLLGHMCEQSPHLQMRLAGAEPALPKPLTIASLPYGYVRHFSDGLWYLGDQAAVIPSFTGDGMSLALHSGVLAAKLYCEDNIAAQYQQTFASQVRRQVDFATAVSKAIVSAPRAGSTLPKLWPGVLGFIARRTRISQNHLIA